MALPPPRFPIKDRQGLERYVLESSRAMGINGPEVWKSIRDRKPAGRFILAALGVSEDLVAASHRPRSLDGALRYEEGIRRHIDAGRSEAEAVALVARENGVKPASVRTSRRRNPNIVAERYFEERQT